MLRVGPLRPDVFAAVLTVAPIGPASTRWWADYPKSTTNLELFSTEEFQIFCGPWAHRLRRYRFPVGPRGPAPTRGWGRYPKSNYSWDYLETIDDR